MESNDYRAAYDDGYSEGYDDGVLEYENVREDTLAEVLKKVEELERLRLQHADGWADKVERAARRTVIIIFASELKSWLNKKLEDE